MKASAPGKVILFGEHAVVYGRHAVVTAINLRCHAEAKKSNEIRIDSPIATTGLNFEKHPYISYAIKRFMEVKPVDGVEIKIESQIPIASGLGSSAAVTVSVLKAMDAEFDAGLSNDEIFELARKVELDVQGIGSGTDPFVSTHGGAWLIPERERLNLPNIKILVVNSGESSVTAEMVARVVKLKEELQEVVEKIFDVIDAVAIKSLSTERFSRLFSVNQCMLKAIGVSTKRIDEIIQQLEELGVAAKITGAGGGGSIIGIGGDEALRQAKDIFGGITVEPEGEGVRIED